MNFHASNPSSDGQALPEFSARQREVLAHVLELMVEEGDGFSMAKVCRRANCSKETLYNWFGDRDGLLTATVRWQASKVKMPVMPSGSLTAVALEDGLAAFAVNWLTVITGDISAALNRLAIAHAGSAKSGLGRIVLENGPRAMVSRIQPVLKAAHEQGLLNIGDMDLSLRTFFGLVVADWQIRKLLGEKTKPTKAGIEQAAREAARQFLVLYGTEKTTQT